MKKLLAIFKKKDGVALVTAMSFMIIAIALCGMISTYVIMMTRTASGYSSVNENKTTADQIATEYLESLNSGRIFDSSYSGYTYKFEGDDSSGYTLYVYEEGDSSPVVTIVIEKDSKGNYKYTRYEYGNI